MGVLDTFIESCRSTVRHVMHQVARGLNSLTGGKLSPNTVTIVGLLAHIPIAYLIAQQFNSWAAILLVIFGLFDTLDGELARLQHRASSSGMLLDASTDRIKEVLLYMGVAFALISAGQEYYAVWAVAACGASLCVSYVKAKGEMAVASHKLTSNEVNRLFQDGLLRFEIRMFLLIIGLLFGQLPVALIVIALLSGYTAINRLVKITRQLNVQS